MRTGEIRGACREMSKKERGKELAAAVWGADGLMLCKGVLKGFPFKEELGKVKREAAGPGLHVPLR